MAKYILEATPETGQIIFDFEDEIALLAVIRSLKEKFGYDNLKMQSLKTIGILQYVKNCELTWDYLKGGYTIKIISRETKVSSVSHHLN